MANELPSQISTFKVVGRLVKGVADSNDPGIEPEMIPIEGASIVFTPSLSPAIYVLHGDNPLTIFQEPISATTDPDGYLVVKGETNQGVVLPYGFDPDIQPSGWTWNVSIGVPGFPGKNFSITGDPSNPLDISTLVPVPTNVGAEIVRWQELSTQVEAAVDEFLVDVGGYVEVYDSVTLTTEDTRSSYLKWSLIGDTTVVLQPGLPNKAYSCTIKAAQDSIGNRTLVFVGVATSYKMPIALSIAPYSIDVVRLEWDGDIWTAFLSGVDLGIPS